MTALEDRLRDTLHDMADEAVAVPLLQRLESRPAVHPGRRRLVAVVAAAAVAAIVAATSYVVLRGHEPSIIEPIHRPPKVFRLSDSSSAQPGRASLAVTLPGENDGVDETHLWPSVGVATTRLSASDWVPASYARHLSTDGTRFVRQYNNVGVIPQVATELRVEVVDLRTGASDKLGDERGWCPQLSPDNRTVAMYRQGDDELVLVDVRTGSVQLWPRDPAIGGGSVETGGACTGLGWSPDAQTLTVPWGDGWLVMDRQGAILHRLPGRAPVNSSMSWSPDGRLILLRDARKGRFVVRDLDSGAESVLRFPTADARQPMGWAGTRVVWLAGDPGNQRLVSTDQAGTDPRLWTRLDVGNRVVESVSWSTELSGTARE